jgi:hypothetical protein
MKLFCKIVLLLLLTICSANLSAENFAKPFYGIAYNIHLRTAIANSLCGAYTALVNDVSAVYWNPAALALIEDIELLTSVTYTKKEIDDKYDPVFFSVIGLPTNIGYFALNYYQDNDDVKYSIYSDYYGTYEFDYEINEEKLGLSYSTTISKNLSFGITGNYYSVSRTYGELSTGYEHTYMINYGIHYSLYDENNIRLSFVHRNLGKNVEMKFYLDDDDDGQFDEDPFDLLDNDGDGLIDEDREESPFLVKLKEHLSFGAAVDVYKYNDFIFTLALQLDRLRDNSFYEKQPTTFAMGAEITDGTLFFRTGISLNERQNRFGVGFGYNINLREMNLRPDVGFQIRMEEADYNELLSASVLLQF